MPTFVIPQQGDILKQLGLEPLLCPRCGGNSEPQSTEYSISPPIYTTAASVSPLYPRQQDLYPRQQDIVIKWNCSRCSIMLETIETPGYNSRRIISSSSIRPNVIISRNLDAGLGPIVTYLDGVKINSYDPPKTSKLDTAPCISCKVKIPANECSQSKSPCGHHSNESWDTEVCEWCNARFDNL